MEKIYIAGGNRLEGKVKISGSKNGTLALMAGALLAKGTTVLENVPRIEDTVTMIEMLRCLGVNANFTSENTVEIDATKIKTHEAPYEHVRKMRASFSVAGPMIARLGSARVPMPGGCDIGARPVDFHVKGLQTLGADITIEHGYVDASAEKLKGAKIYLDQPSAGATQHLMTAACLAEGTTIIENAALEPEVAELASMLRAMGARIYGAGTSTIEIHGVEEMTGVRHKMKPDRLEAGTFAIAAAATRGDITLHEVIPDHCTAVFQKLKDTGVQIEIGQDTARIRMDTRPKAVDIKTMPHPGFPTDLQQPFAAMLATASGTSVISETIFERRFKYVGELNRMGADIVQEGHTAVIKGIEKLTGAEVNASDLRAGAALIIAGLSAEGRTTIGGVEHIVRGYERIADKLEDLGAQIQQSISPPESFVKVI